MTMLIYFLSTFQLGANCMSWQLHRSHLDGRFLTVTQRLVLSSSHLHWINKNTLIWRRIKLGNVICILFKWRHISELERQEDHFLWLLPLKLKHWQKEWFWRDFREKVLDRQSLSICAAKHEQLVDCPALQASEFRSSCSFFRLINFEQRKCDPQNLPHLLQQKLSFMVSLPAGEQAATATITVVPTTPVVQEGCPQLLLQLQLRHPTTPWPSPTPTYIYNACPPGLEKKLVSCYPY